MVTVYTGTALNTLTPAYTSSSSCGIPVTLYATQGQTYWIAVSGSAAEATLQLDAPENDQIVPPRYLSTTTIGSTRTATKSPGEANHAGDPGGHSVWFQCRRPAPGRAARRRPSSAPATAASTPCSPPTTRTSGVALTANDDSDGCGPGGHGSVVRFTGRSGRVDA